MNYIPSPALGNITSEVNVLTYGADPTGVADSTPAILAAINSFSGINSYLAGTVLFPYGTYRLASTLRIKKTVRLKGVQTGFGYLSCALIPDPGIDGVVFERYNTPFGTTSTASGDDAMMENITVFYNNKVNNWIPSQSYNIGDKSRTGTGAGQDWRRHYVCTQAGTSAASGIGPRSLGRDYLLNYTGRTGSFVRGQYVYGVTSGNFGEVILDAPSGANGVLKITNPSGYFLNGETINDGLGVPLVTATANGTATLTLTNELDGTARWQYTGGAHGIKSRANGIKLRDVSVWGASGNGVHLEALDPEIWIAGDTNADNWQFDNLIVYGCDGHGFYLNGGDANGGVLLGGQLLANGSHTSDEIFTGSGYNLYDSSFLGNAYIGTAFQLGGLGSIFCDSAAPASTFIGCYQEGTGGGSNVFNGCVVVGGNLAAQTEGVGPFLTLSSGSVPGRGFAQKVAGFSTSLQWRYNQVARVGDYRWNGPNVYYCTQAGITAAAGGGPTGTGTGIVDNTVIWDFFHVTTIDGNIELGSPDASYPIFMSLLGPDEYGKSDVTYMRQGSFGNLEAYTNTIAWTHGLGGNRVGLMHANQLTKINSWPMHPRVGTCLLDSVYLTGSRMETGTGIPSDGTWNPGDKHYYKGTACIAGGAEGKVCVTEGTQGTYVGGRTATSTGSSTLTISGGSQGTYPDNWDFHVGDILTINGTTARVLNTSNLGQTIVMGLPITAGSGLAIVYSAPVFKEFGTISL